MTVPSCRSLGRSQGSAVKEEQSTVATSKAKTTGTLQCVGTDLTFQVLSYNYLFDLNRNSLRTSREFEHKKQGNCFTQGHSAGAGREKANTLPAKGQQTRLWKDHFSQFREILWARAGPLEARELTSRALQWPSGPRAGNSGGLGTVEIHDNMTFFPPFSVGK